MDIDSNGILEGDELPRRLKKGEHYRHDGPHKSRLDQIVTKPETAG